MEPENLSSPAADDEAALQPSTAEAPDAEESSAEIRPEPETPPARAMLTADDIGRNERAEAMINRPLLFENPRRTATAPDADPPAADGLTEGFLTGLRPGVWD